ncbi:phosphatidylinositol mannoside acyltransferase [Actinophytocola xanthii]|uniref:Phosphatidylinositol mannoside acyltransferase n=1 Tax=Actinophytocola xanthii TaxID=1912961 RepID=A0A1Q8CZ42_9PSEU|nr:phosphatidylinositol mannoside acyltransferase [Actinophytocola xanthii]OLF19606.1 phosphatidylinositol mannoside acyltransferase [Actinophytocola xanthii]
MSIGHRMVDLGFAAGWSLVRRLPVSVARGSFRTAADLAVRRGGPGVRQLRRNYARVVPQAGPEELDELVRDGVRSYARYWMETFRLPGMDHREIYRRVDEVVVGRSLVDAALERGKGVVFALPHTGNFDVSGIWMVGHLGSFTTVAERLRPESLYRRFLAYRESLGFEILPSTGGDRAPYRVLMERLRENRAVCLPADRDLSRRGVPVKFFGAATRMPAGPARLAAATGAELLIADNSFTEDGWGLRLHTPMLVHGRDEAASATQRMADAFAADIAANPVDWHMMQKLWLEDLSEQRRASLGEPEEASESR